MDGENELNNSHNNHNNHSINDGILNLLKPLSLSATLMGLMHGTWGREFKDTNQRKLHTEKKMMKLQVTAKKGLRISTKVYALAVLIILLLNAVKFTVAICLYSDHFAVRLANLIWSWQCFSNAVIVFWICHKDIVLSLIIHKQKYFERSTERHAWKALVKRQSKMVLTLVSISWLFLLLNAVYILFSLFGPYVDLSQCMEAIIVDPLPKNCITKMIFLVFHFLDTAAWVFPTTFYCIISNILNSWFTLCTENLKKTIQKSPNRFPDMFEEIRKNHFELCQAVSTTDNSLKYISILTYASNIPIVCFLLYELLTTSMNGFSIGLSIFWMTVDAWIVIVLSLTSAFLHEKVYT